jgi:hypothetical protein
VETGAISTASPARHSCDPSDSPKDAKMGRKSRVFSDPITSLDSHFSDRGLEIAESLWPPPRIFPFCRDYRQRLGLITTAARSTQWILTNPVLSICLASLAENRTSLARTCRTRSIAYRLGGERHRSLRDDALTVLRTPYASIIMINCSAKQLGK